MSRLKNTAMAEKPNMRRGLLPIRSITKPWEKHRKKKTCNLSHERGTALWRIVSLCQPIGWCRTLVHREISTEWTGMQFTSDAKGLQLMRSILTLVMMCWPVKGVHIPSYEKNAVLCVDLQNSTFIKYSV